MNMRSEPEVEVTKVNARYPVDLLEAFDKLFPKAGYATRQDALRDMMRSFVQKEGVKQIAVIEKVKQLA